MIRSASGYQTVSMLDGGRTGLYFDWGEKVALARPDARVVVLLGLGGGEMLRSAHRALPHATLIGVDIDPSAISKAYDEFGAAALGVIGVNEDAKDFAHRLTPGSVDLLFVDLYDDDQIPPPFTRPEFFGDCRRALAHDGLLVMNVYPTSKAELVRDSMRDAGMVNVQATGLAEGNVMLVAEP